MTTVEKSHSSALGDHVAFPAAGVNTEGTQADEYVDAALERGEEEIMEDVEIPSDTEEVTETIERQMLTVALVHSVVDASKAPVAHKKPAETTKSLKPAKDIPKFRYGLRKRRRSSSSSTSANNLEGKKGKTDEDENDASNFDLENDNINGGDEATTTATTTCEGGTGEVKPQSEGNEVPGAAAAAACDSGTASKDCNETQIKTIPRPKIDPDPATHQNPCMKTNNITSTEICAKVENVPPTVASKVPQVDVIPAPSNVASLVPAPIPILAPVLTAPISSLQPPPPPPTMKAMPAPPAILSAVPQPVLPEEILPSTGAVPNPLSSHLQHPSAPLQHPGGHQGEHQTMSTTPGTMGVPCPLGSSVPCPLPPVAAKKPEAVTSEKSVTIVEPPKAPARARIFSVDIDPATFDFPDMYNMDQQDTEKDADGANVPTPSGMSESSTFQRDRAFSFEFFNFHGDELLPPALVVSTATSELPEPGKVGEAEEENGVTRRPRGDSIIFDPVSFQDGGIHEKNALLKARASSVDSGVEGLLEDTSEYANNSSNKGMTEPTDTTPAVSTNTPNPIPSYDVVAPTNQNSEPTGEMATLPSALNTNPANATQPATFQMELLNKDGRIGIYLPDARKARIARFHAKRKMRIWRKRIKYDCRKKLADSRPRIKGRFVKRSDMEED